MFEWNAFELGVQNPLYSSWVHSLILPHQPHQPHHHVCIKLYCFYKYSFFASLDCWIPHVNGDGQNALPQFHSIQILCWEVFIGPRFFLCSKRI
jgi:hypothetical protein